eukprot:symbB.v1.2.023688.t1/scaffold2188.1/size86315/3
MAVVAEVEEAEEVVMIATPVERSAMWPEIALTRARLVSEKCAAISEEVNVHAATSAGTRMATVRNCNIAGLRSERCAAGRATKNLHPIQLIDKH